jgi:hypothetical protein
MPADPLDMFGVQDFDPSTNNEQDEELNAVLGGAAPAVDEEDPISMFGLEAPPPAPVDVVPEEEPGLLDQLIGGYYDFRSRERYETAVKRAKGPELEKKELTPGSMAARRYEPGTIGALEKEFTPEERKQRVQKALEQSQVFAAKGREIPLSAETMEFLDENSDKTIWEAFKEAPVKIITELGARSGASMAPGLALGMGAAAFGGGPLGFAAGLGTGSARVDYAATIMQGMTEAGVDPTDAQAVIDFVQSPQMDELEKAAMKRAAVVGGVDAISGLIGAKNLAPGMSSAIAREATNAAIQLPTQAALGAAGEAGGQLAMGQELQPREIAAEAAGELVTAPVEIAGAAIAGARAEQETAGPGPLEDLTADEIQNQLQGTAEDRANTIRVAQEAARAEAALKGADALEQEMAAAMAGASYSKAFQPELDRLQRLWNQRLAADEEARYFEEQQKEDAKREEIQAAAAKRYEEGLAQIEQERQAEVERARTRETVAKTAAGIETAATTAQLQEQEAAAQVAEKQQRAEKASMQFRKLRRRRQELGLEPKTDEGLPEISPLPAPAEVEAFKGKRPPSSAMAQAFTLAAETAATSPTNRIPEPTQAQIEAGNYKKGHARVQGLDISIENPAGSTRKGPGWSQKIRDHYGYIKRTSSAEGPTEQLDVFVGDDQASQTAFVVDQLNQETGEFDEHKVMLGYPNKFAAIRAYRRNYPKGWKMGPITEMPMDEFKQWTKSGDMTRPLQKVARPSPKVPASEAQFEEVIQAETRKEGRRPRILFRLDEKQERKINKPGTAENKAAEKLAKTYFDEKAISDAKTQNYKSRETLVYMRPRDFLKMAERLRFADEQKAQGVRAVLDQFGEKFNSVPILGFENEGDVARTVSHEGRHRAMELKRRGVEFMPVRLISHEGGKAPAIRWQEYIEEGGKLPNKMVGQSGGEIPFPVFREFVETQPPTTREDMTIISRAPDGALRALPRKIQTVDGPKTRGPWEKAVDVAKQYMADAGMEYRPPGAYVTVDRARAERIAEAFDKMEHNPQDPQVREAYNALIDETVAQYKAILRWGKLKVEFVPEGQSDPYYSPQGAIDDLVENNHLWVFPTRAGFGTAEEFDPAGNPLLEETEFKISGQTALANDIFRIVHDYFGHAKEGVGFRANGEENAWRAHSAMFSPLAQRALTTETRGQNSWLNFGPYGESNRKAKTGDTHFADQKIGLLPEWAALEGLDDKGYEKEESAPRTTSELAKALRDEGGFSADAETGAAVRSGYAVGVGLEERLRGYAGEAFIEGYRRRHAEELAKPNRVLGGWVYEGESYMDVSRVFPETQEGLSQAIALGKKNRELGIMRLSKAESGEGYIALEYSQEELSQPVEGDTVKATHYSTVKGLGTLEGIRYGTGIKGAEAERLEYPGFEDIVPRVYFYAGKFRKERGLGPHEYNWTQEGLYNIEKDPMGYRTQARQMAFEAGYANGDSRAVANFFDRIVKEAGYQGIYAPGMNGTGYVFGDVVPEIQQSVLNSLFRHGAAEEQVVTLEDIKAIAADIQGKLPLLNVEAVATPEDLPVEIYSELEQMGGDALFRAKGLYHVPSGKLYVFASNASSLQDVTRTILHEGIAHKGLRYLLGPDLPDLLRSVYDGADRVSIERIADRYGLDLENEQDQLVAAE